ncbi:hypothetical protein KVR01_008178 [Diaporthe batatas]|uniref:uncharacterized protein n=1 Tax=Diaporthe batatas TaxID=748121 RepID=UPI001D051722|nr:uncharacterized protein KVR01_008178 [Diaporthe batatas]KAG8162413.1 hypothetical protein KVR01_008178 [Diaporthe batatas]
MDKGEQLALIQRVAHSSGNQAKEALESMILKCGTRHSTIARAIRDAVERYTPAPTIVYENPGTNNDSDASLAPSPPMRRNKKKDESDGRRADETTRSGTSDDDPGALRRHAKASKKAKTATTGKKNVSVHRNHQQSNLDKKRKKYKEAGHAPTHAPGTEHRTIQTLVGRPSEQAKMNVANLVTPSHLEISEQDRLLGRNLKNDVSDDDLAVVISSEDEPWYAAGPHKNTVNNGIANNQSSKIGNLEADISITDSSDDESSIDERQGNALAVAAGPPQASSNVKTTQAGAGNSDGGVHAQSFTIPIREAFNPFGAGKPSSVLLSKKRKAQDPPAEKTQPAKTANDY